MKVATVSNISFNSQNTKSQVLNPYFYTLNEDYKPDYSFKEHKLEYFGGFLALIAAAVSLSKFMGRNTTPKSVVELVDKAIGFNKIKHSKRSISQIKERILYPIMSLENGEKKVMKGDFKTGLIIGGKNPEKLEEFTGAFKEHAKTLNIKWVDIKFSERNRRKEVHKAIDSAIKSYEHDGKCVIVNIGDLSVATTLNPAKLTQASNIEGRLANMPKGVLWTAYTTETEKIPYFYNNIPTLCVKISD